MSEQRFSKAFSGNAPENYERYFVPAIGAPLADDLVEIADLRPGERVLDVACGTGVVARIAAQKVGANGTVTGLDVSPGMLAVARAATSSDMTIQWHEASAEKTSLTDLSFDVVLCQMGLQFMPNKPAALREIHRILAPGGRLVLNAPGPTPPLMEVLGDSLAHHVGPEAEGFVKHVFSIHDTVELRRLIEGAGFSDVSVRVDTRWLHLPSPKEFLWEYVHSTPLARAVAEASNEQRESLERDVVARWQKFVENGSMMFKVRIVIVTAWKQ